MSSLSTAAQVRELPPVDHLESIQDAGNLCDCHAKRRKFDIDLRGMDEGDVRAFDSRSSREQVEADQDASCYV